MENGLIPDTAISASSWYKYNTDFYGPNTARLNLDPYGPWVKHETDDEPWIQVCGESDVSKLKKNLTLHNSLQLLDMGGV